MNTYTFDTIVSLAVVEGVCERKPYISTAKRIPH